MNKNDYITFILVGNKDDQLIKEFNEMDSVMNYGNAIILRGSDSFLRLYDNMNDNFQFKLIVHYGLKEDAKSVGKKIATALRSKYDIDLEYFTREISVFNETNQLSTQYPANVPSDKQIKLYNFDEMNSESFIEQLPVICKKVTLKSNSKTNETVKNKPKIFIGSSVKGLPIARAIRESLKYDATVHLWDDNGCFNTNEAILDGLEKIVNAHDYGIFIFRPDDEIYEIQQGNTKVEIPRDNVIFEYGLFMGKHTRKKVYFMIPNPKGDFKLMSDLLGIKPLDYKVDKVIEAEKETNTSQKKLLYSEAVSSACDSIKTDISI